MQRRSHARETGSTPPAALLALVLAFAALAAAAPPAAAVSRAREEYLAAELAAARGRSLYLVLDPRSQAVDLKVDGFLLHRFVVERALLGTPWGAGTPIWPALGFRLVSDVPAPDRQPIPIRHPGPAATGAGATAGAGVAAGASLSGVASSSAMGSRSGMAPRSGVTSRSTAAAVAEVPAGMPQDSLRQVPSHYLLRFAPDLDVLVVGSRGTLDGGSLLWRLGRRLREGWQVAADRLAGRRVTPRLLLVMAPDEARRLFVALRADTRLLIAAAD
jgi:hypothetical protein